MNEATRLGIETDGVQRIDSIIAERGSCLLKESQLKELFLDEGFHSKWFLLMADLTRERQWSFEFQHRTGDVRIAPLAR